MSGWPGKARLAGSSRCPLSGGLLTQRSSDEPAVGGAWWYPRPLPRPASVGFPGGAENSQTGREEQPEPNYEENESEWRRKKANAESYEPAPPQRCDVCLDKFHNPTIPQVVHIHTIL